MVAQGFGFLGRYLEIKVEENTDDPNIKQALEWFNLIEASYNEQKKVIQNMENKLNQTRIIIWQT